MNDEERETSDHGSDHAMTDDTDDEGVEQATNEDAERTGAEADSETSEAATDPEDRLDDGIRRKLNYALLMGLGLLALIAVIQFYFNMSSVINQWVTREYRSLFQAVFNLVVLLVVGAAISRQVRRLAD